MKNRTHKRKCRPFLIGGGIILGIGVAILIGFIIMWLWNGLMPKLFGLTTITYWQGLGLALLGRLLFGGVGCGSNNNRNKKNHHCYDYHHSVPFYDKIKDWEYYDQWWKEKGEKSFKEYTSKDSDPDVEVIES